MNAFTYNDKSRILLGCWVYFLQWSLIQREPWICFSIFHVANMNWEYVISDFSGISQVNQTWYFWWKDTIVFVWPVFLLLLLQGKNHFFFKWKILQLSCANKLQTHCSAVLLQFFRWNLSIPSNLILCSGLSEQNNDFKIIKME